MSAAGAVLRAVVGTYGAAALTDPVALRAALRRVGQGLPAAESSALLAVAGADVADALRAGLVEEAVSAVRRGGAEVAGELPEADLRAACAAFAEVLRPGAEPVSQPAPRSDPAAAVPRLTWEEPATRPATTPGGPPEPRGRARWIAFGAADPHALDQVAQRYRALGAELVAGALRCAPLPPDRAETERVSCDFAGTTMVLVDHDSTGRLREHREAVLAATPRAARSASATGAGAAFAMAEEVGGRSTVYWDVESPRPVSATVTASRPLAELVAFHDARRFAALQRPDLPGPAFGDPALWQHAAVVVVGDGASAGPRRGSGTSPGRWSRSSARSRTACGATSGGSPTAGT